MPATLTRRHMKPLEQAGSRYAELMRLSDGLARTKTEPISMPATPTIPVSSIRVRCANGNSVDCRAVRRRTLGRCRCGRRRPVLRHADLLHDKSVQVFRRTHRVAAVGQDLIAEECTRFTQG